MPPRARPAAPPAAPAPPPATAGNTGGLTIDGISILKPPYGLISAINLDKGEIAWQAVHGHVEEGETSARAAVGGSAGAGAGSASDFWLAVPGGTDSVLMSVRIGVPLSLPPSARCS